MTKKDISFGEFISKLAAEPDKATNETLAGLQEKLQKEKQARIEQRLRCLFNTMQQTVADLREVRRQEAMYLDKIKELEARGNRIVSGEDEDDTGSSYYAPVCRRVRRV